MSTTQVEPLRWVERTTNLVTAGEIRRAGRLPGREGQARSRHRRGGVHPVELRAPHPGDDPVRGRLPRRAHLRGQHGQPRVGELAHERHSFVHGDVRDPDLMRQVVAEVDVIVNAAAESHVEKSIESGASEFVTTNVEGTQILLDAIRETARRALHPLLVERGVRHRPLRAHGRGAPAQPAQPVRGHEGGRRPARVLVLRHVRPADRDRPPVQQLRARASIRRR